MIVARWSITAKFGKAGQVIGLLKEWNQTFGKEVGMLARGERVLQGSVGACESEIQTEVVLDTLSDLDAAFAKLATLDGHAEWSRKLEPLVVSGTNRWSVYREI